MKRFISILCALTLYGFSAQCQNTKAFSFSLSAGFMYNDHYEDLLFRPVLCETTCEVQSQKSKHGLTIEAQVYWRFSKRHYLSLGYALLERGVHETTIDARGETFHTESRWDYSALQAAYRLDIIARDKFRLFTQNGLALEFVMGEPDFGNILARQNWSFYTDLGLEWQATANAAILLSPQFRTNISTYSIEKYNAISSNYRPYSMSGKLGVRFGF